ncbi:MAG TPA: hypothetical protein VGL89_09155 [Candidatus Koribacter sp.]|jgi:hypothetical protein
MRVLKVVCGIAVLFMALHMVHAIEHFTHMRNEMSAWMWDGVLVVGVVADLLSAVGGVLLIMGK